MRRSAVVAGLVGLSLAAGLGAQDTKEPEKTLDVVATAHLDTQWRWTMRDTIETYIPATLRDNFALFEKYPGYTFSFEGAFRYMLVKEYYPADWERLKGYAAQGRWRVAGSWVDAADTNIPSPESLFRQALYGNGFFRRELGQTSRDVFLPDCFGFGYALPSIAAHSGLCGFSSQKLTWGSASGVPFDVGLWQGVDGSNLVAALNPGDYVSKIEGDLSADPAVLAALDRTGAASGQYVGMKYFGVGDQGGAPEGASVAWLERSLAGKGPVNVRSVASDQLARDLAAGGSPTLERLPRYRGELLMTSHGAGCYTSQAAMKRWNRKNEVLADAAERAAVAADWLGAMPYPRAALRDAWVRLLDHQFHDDLTGTSIPEAYAISWNDEAIVANQLAGVLDDAVGAVSRALDTRVEGVPVVVYNPLSIAREDVVEAELSFPDPLAVRVFAPDGGEVPAQLVRVDAHRANVSFLAALPAVGFAVFDVRPAMAPSGTATSLAASASVLENGRYRLEVDANGDVASIRDKLADRELLARPLQLQLLADSPAKWPAWEVGYDDLSAPPRAVVGGPAQVRIVESGPARVAIEVTRHAAGSTFVQTIRLGAGSAGDRVEVETEVDWRTKGTLLKAAFPLATASETATYDLGLGTIERGLSTPKLYEVPAQRWADLTATDGRYGVAILDDSRYGWDHPDPATLRLSLVHTPAVGQTWRWVGDQASQDLGRHRLSYALVGHAGDWRAGGVTWQADRLNQPLLAWQAPKHDGPLGRVFSLAEVRSPDDAVAIRALKRAEEGEEVVVRLAELQGRPVEAARLSFVRPVVAFREVNAAEEPLPARDPRAATPARLENGTLVVPFAPYQPRTFALRLGEPPARLSPPVATPLQLPYDLDGVTFDGATDGDLDGEGHTIAAELLPGTLTVAGVPFRFGPTAPGQANVLISQGQRLALPSGDWNRVYLLAASVAGDLTADVGGAKYNVPLWVQDWSEPVGQWDSRLDAGRLVEDPARIVPAYLKPERLGWLGTHRHDAQGRNQAYAFTQLFLYPVDLLPGAGAVTLPRDRRVRILAATAARTETDAAWRAQPLGDVPDRAAVRIEAPRAVFVGSMQVELSSPNPGAELRYTLDGSEPGPLSSPVRGPLTLTETTTITARASAPGLDQTYLAQATFTRLEPRPAVAVPDARQGLACRYFEGEWKQLPDFAALTPARTAVVPEVGLPSFARPEGHALELAGYLKVPADGLYTLSLRSDDGSALFLGDERLVDADGIHGEGDERTEVALAAGLHPIRVLYFQAKGDKTLQLWLAGPGFAMRPVSPEELFHR